MSSDQLRSPVADLAAAAASSVAIASRLGALAAGVDACRALAAAATAIRSLQSVLTCMAKSAPLGQAISRVAELLSDQPIEVVAQAAEAIMAPSQIDSRRAFAWSMVVAFIAKERLDPTQSLEVISLLRQDGWRDVDCPAAYLKRALHLARKFEKAKARRKQALHVQVDGTDSPAEAYAVSNTLYRQRFESGVSCWSHRDAVLRERVPSLSQEQRELIGARREGHTQKTAAGFLGWDPSRVARVWRSLASDRLKS